MKILRIIPLAVVCTLLAACSSEATPDDLSGDTSSVGTRARTQAELIREGAARAEQDGVHLEDMEGEEQVREDDEAMLQIPRSSAAATSAPSSL